MYSTAPAVWAKLRKDQKYMDQNVTKTMRMKIPVQIMYGITTLTCKNFLDFKMYHKNKFFFIISFLLFSSLLVFLALHTKITTLTGILVLIW